MNQLPEVRRFILGVGNADSYIGLGINFIPHHSPVLVLFDDSGAEKETVDIADYDFNGLLDLMEGHGFRKKELL